MHFKRANRVQLFFFEVEIRFDFWILFRPILVVGLVIVAASLSSLGLLVVYAVILIQPAFSTRNRFHSNGLLTPASYSTKLSAVSLSSRPMAYYRGRGRGRGYGGGGFSGYFKPEPVVLFPDVELPDVKGVPEEKTLVIWNSRLQNYWKASPYYLEENVSKKSQSKDIERYSDWEKPKSTSKRDSLNQILQLQSHNFPKELIGDSRRAQRSAKKMRWNLDSGLDKLDTFEKFEQGLEDPDKEGKEKKGDGEEDNTDEELGELSDESYSDDGDYNENEHFDDDEDDYNQEDGNDEAANGFLTIADEPIY
ncbi:DNA-directed RNA polymerase III [Theobroma cacao]|nr:DNA-directed RNA polymerase III [Theobroma cacao]